MHIIYYYFFQLTSSFTGQRLQRHAHQNRALVLELACLVVQAIVCSKQQATSLATYFFEFYLIGRVRQLFCVIIDSNFQMSLGSTRNTFKYRKMAIQRTIKDKSRNIIVMQELLTHLIQNLSQKLLLQCSSIKRCFPYGMTIRVRAEAQKKAGQFNRKVCILERTPKPCVTFPQTRHIGSTMLQEIHRCSSLTLSDQSLIRGGGYTVKSLCILEGLSVYMHTKQTRFLRGTVFCSTKHRR